MFKNIFLYFLLRKADRARVEKILKQENFIYTKEDIENILKGNQKGTRYGNIVLERMEDGQKQKRFLKIILDGTLRTHGLFSRQVMVTNMLHEYTKVGSPTLAVIKYSLFCTVPYAIFETLESGDGFGFMNDSMVSYDNFSESEMKNLVNTIYAFHQNGEHVDPRIWKYTQKISSDLDNYKKSFEKLFNTIVVHKKKNGEIVKEKVETLLIFYTNVPDIKTRIVNRLVDNWEYVDSSRAKNKYYLVHADMQIDNVYKNKNGNFELLDFEWVGQSDTPTVAIMYDYGNLRARAWSSPSFQSMLDGMMLEVGVNYYEDIGTIRAGMNLGILRSSLMMSRYHLDFENTTKKDKRTESEYENMYERGINGLRQVLSV